MRPDPEFTLIIDNQSFVGWLDLEVSRSIERMGGQFRVEMTDNRPAAFLAGVVVPGLPVIARIDGQTVLSGHIDTVESEFDGTSTRTTITGRDKTGDLVDCAAAVDGPFEFNDQTLEQAVKKILSPFGIPLRIAVSTGAAFKRLAIQPGETAYEFIDRACRYRGLLPVADGVGGLAIVKPGGSRASGRLVYGQNILKGRTVRDFRERFSLYAVKGQAEAQDLETADDTAGPEGRSSDPLITRYRPKLVIAENQGYDLTMAQRAEWERKVARARSQTAAYDVQGWYADGAEALWKPDSIVRVADADRGLDRDMLITGVTFRRSAAGTVTSLDLAVPEAFDLPAEKEPDTDVWGTL